MFWLGSFTTVTPGAVWEKSIRLESLGVRGRASKTRPERPEPAVDWALNSRVLPFVSVIAFPPSGFEPRPAPALMSVETTLACRVARLLTVMPPVRLVGVTRLVLPSASVPPVVPGPVKSTIRPLLPVSLE